MRFLYKYKLILILGANAKTRVYRKLRVYYISDMYSRVFPGKHDICFELQRRIAGATTLSYMISPFLGDIRG